MASSSLSNTLPVECKPGLSPRPLKRSTPAAAKWGSYSQWFCLFPQKEQDVSMLVLVVNFNFRECLLSESTLKRNLGASPSLDESQYYLLVRVKNKKGIGKAVGRSEANHTDYKRLNATGNPF